MLLVTGATGLLGNCVVRELLAKGETVRALVRGELSRRELAGLDIELVRGSIEDAAAVQQAVNGCRAVIHCGALIHIGYQQVDQSRRINVEGTCHIIAACVAAGARLIHVSTVDTLPTAIDPQHPVNEESAGVPNTECAYVISKREAERAVVEACRASLDGVIVHPGLMLGPYDWKPSSGAMLLAMVKAPVLVVPRGTASVCDARDVAAAVVAAVTAGRRGEHYILAGENISYPELSRRMLEVAQQSKRIFRMGPVIPAVASLVDAWNKLTGCRVRFVKSTD
jgi:dihydroflavonol-4-reductase